MDEHIREKFRKIDVPLRWAESPREFSRSITDRESETAFMIDVRKRRGRSRPFEYVLMYRGRAARVEAIHHDCAHRQVLLDVREPRSVLLLRQFDRHAMQMYEEEMVIAAAHRRILVGMDESHLFICPLYEKASTVQEAHRKLAPAEVHEARRNLSVKRQGEWFFVPVHGGPHQQAIEEALGVGRLETQCGLVAAGRPHVADEALRLQEETYVRGAVRHPDHRVLQLKQWHRVLCNTEDTSTRPTGRRWNMKWVD